MSPQKEPHSIAMETSAPKDSIKAPIYTHGSYWGGPQLPYWIFLLVTTLPFTGFFGIDHLLFRSPSTAFTKGITNIFTFGLWYVYDIIQAFNDREFIENYGFSKPAVGPGGLALDYFSDITGKKSQSGGGPDESTKKSGLVGVLLFICYMFTLFTPFGISNFVAGDSSGGLFKLVLSLLFPLSLFWIPYFFVGSFFELYRVLFNTAELFEKGTLRIPPTSIALGNNGFAPNLMNPKALAEESKKEAEDTFFNKWIKPVLSYIPLYDVLDTTKCAVVPPAKQVVDAAQKAADGGKALVSTIPKIAAKTVDTVNEFTDAFTDPKKLEALAKAQQVGGAMSGVSAGYYDWIVLGGLALLVFGGFAASILRKYNGSKKNDEPSLQESSTDTPPKPGRV